MARVTVEDCIELLPNRFELVAIAATRAKQIASGNPINIERDNDKDTVVALREIADKKLDLNALRNELTQNYQKYGKQDTIDEIQSGFGMQKPRNDIDEELTAMVTAADDLNEEKLTDLEFGEDDITEED